MSVYSQTFEKRSSLPPNPPLPPPPVGLLCAGGGLLIGGATGAALLHPPKSSSGATSGVTWELLLKPLLEFDDWVFKGAEVPPQAEKSLDMGIDGACTGATGFASGADVAFVDSGVAQASLEPHASMFEKPDGWFIVAGFTIEDDFTVA